MKHYNYFLILFLLAICLPGLTGCKATKGEMGPKPMQSCKVEADMWFCGHKEYTITFRCDEQNRLVAYRDTFAYAYTYSGDSAFVECKYVDSDELEFSGNVYFNSDGLPRLERNHYPNESVPETVRHFYDESQRLVRTEQRVTNSKWPSVLDYDILREDGSVDVTRIEYHMVFDDKDSRFYYTLEYLDEENPIEFYPELSFIMNPSPVFNLGRAGYSRSKLLKRIGGFYENGEQFIAVSFSYQYDADGKLKECILSRQETAADGAPQGEKEVIRYYDMKYEE